MSNVRNRFISAILLIPLIFCAGCGKNQQAENEKEQNISGTSADRGIETESTGQTSISGHENDTVIETVYGNLYFPDQWQEFLVTDQKEGDGTVSISFAANIKEQNYPLFTVTIGGEEDNPAGSLTDADGNKRNVYVKLDEIPESDALNEGEQNRLYAMQEDVNYLLDNLE